MQQSEVVAVLVPEGSGDGAQAERAAVMLVRRADGQFALATIDARVARARHVASAGAFRR